MTFSSCFVLRTIYATHTNICSLRVNDTRTENARLIDIHRYGRNANIHSLIWKRYQIRSMCLTFHHQMIFAKLQQCAPQLRVKSWDRIDVSLLTPLRGEFKLFPTLSEISGKLWEAVFSPSNPLHQERHSDNMVGWGWTVDLRGWAARARTEK